VGLDTMVKRPLINTRDEPHAHRERYRRLHVIVGDANMSEYTTYLKVGTTLVVLHMLEAGVLVPAVALRSPVQACKTISHDPTCTALVPLANGKRVTAIDLQRCFHAAAQRYIETHPECPPTYPALVTEWGAVLDRLARDPMQLYREIDWVMKLHLLTNYMARRHSGWEDPRMALMDLQYHDVRPDKGLYFLLERSGTARRLLTEAEIVQAMDEPPEDTRAYVRGQCVKKFPDQLWSVSWDALAFKCGDGPVQRLRMEEPTCGTKHQVQQVLDRSATAADFVAHMTSAPLGGPSPCEDSTGKARNGVPRSG
jgi:Pup amidohydrolase